MTCRTPQGSYLRLIDLCITGMATLGEASVFLFFQLVAYDPTQVGSLSLSLSLSLSRSLSLSLALSVSLSLSLFLPRSLSFSLALS